MSLRLRLPRPAWIFTAFALVAVAVPVAVKVGVDHAARASFTDAGPGLTDELGYSTTDPSDLSATGLGAPPPTAAGPAAPVAGAGSAVSALAAPDATTTTAPLPWILGQRPFAARSSWNTPIPAGANYVNIGMPAVEVNNYWVDWDYYAPAVWFSKPSDPLVTVTHPSGWGYPAGTLQIHLPDGITGAKGGDRSILVVDGTKVYNMWQFNRTSATTATAKAFAQADVLSGTGWGGHRSDGQPLGAGITAAGHSMLAGLLIQAETDSGEIRHALQLSVDGRLNNPGFVGEAIHSDGDANAGIMQQGQRLAIPPDVPMPSGLSPLGQKVFRALQVYGAFDVDTSGGSTVLRAQSNAYDTRTIDKLRDDFKKMGPLLHAVNF